MVSKNQILGDQIKTAMAAAGWTQAALAEATGLEQANVSRILSGETNPGWSTVCRIAAALGIEISTDPG